VVEIPGVCARETGLPLAETGGSGENDPARAAPVLAADPGAIALPVPGWSGRVNAPRASEKRVQAAVVRLYRTFGCLTFSLSQPRATMQAEGLPDLWVFAPRRRAAWWHECKREGGALRAEQFGFAELCRACDVGHVIGGLAEARAKLEALGLVARVA
jgi:hypothetical protein